MILTCGEGGSTGSEVLGQINTNTEDIADHEVRVSAIEANHALLLNCESTAASQEPTSTDTPIQVEYGASQAVAKVSMASNGALTFVEAGKYQININAHYGRSGASGTSYLLFRLLMDGIAFGGTLASKIDSANTLVPWSNTFIIQAQAGQVLTTELMRDSAGNDSGGLYKVAPTLAGWNDASNITLQIYEV